MSLLLLFNQASGGGVASAYSLSLSSGSGVVGSPVTLTFTGNGTTTTLITPHVSGVSGTFSPTTVALNGTTSVTLTFTPSSAGTATLFSTNGSTLTDPGSQNYTVTNTTATSYTLSLSASSGNIGIPVTLTLTGNGVTSAVITLPSPGVAGTYSNSTPSLNGTTPVTVTFTPSIDGTCTFAPTNISSLGNPANRTYTVNPAGESVAVYIGYLLIGTGTSWSGSPFSLINPNGSSIFYQGVVDGTHAFVVVTSVSTNTGPYQLSDGVSLDVVLPQIIPVANTSALIAVNVSSGGSA